MRSFVLAVGALFLACGSAPKPVPKTPEPIAAPAIARYIAGGDSRNDVRKVLPWAFQEAKLRRATAFLFLGDMEFTPSLDGHFEDQLRILDPVPFYPVLGNHEVRLFGFIKSGTSENQAIFRQRFLGNSRTPVHSSIPNKVVYSVNLPGGVHFVALDNVSQKGFGEEQLAWLKGDLEAARADASVHHIIVGMHKPLAHNGISTHGMDKDGAKSIADSEAAAALFAANKVSLILASHVHGFATYAHAGIPTYITGGLGAPLSNKLPQEGAYHHFLQIDVGPSALEVSVVRFGGGIINGEEDDDD
jgi:hypothetical protein